MDTGLNLEKLTNAEIRSLLLQYGLNPGPVVKSTRKIYIDLLESTMLEATTTFSDSEYLSTPIKQICNLNEKNNSSKNEISDFSSPTSNYQNLSNQEIRDILIDKGQSPGPVVESTRNIYISQLQKMEMNPLGKKVITTPTRYTNKASAKITRRSTSQREPSALAREEEVNLSRPKTRSQAKVDSPIKNEEKNSPQNIYTTARNEVKQSMLKKTLHSQSKLVVKNVEIPVKRFEQSSPNNVMYESPTHMIGSQSPELPKPFHQNYSITQLTTQSPYVHTSRSPWFKSVSNTQPNITTKKIIPEMVSALAVNTPPANSVLRSFSNLKSKSLSANELHTKEVLKKENKITPTSRFFFLSLVIATITMFFISLAAFTIRLIKDSPGDGINKVAEVIISPHSDHIPN